MPKTWILVFFLLAGAPLAQAAEVADYRFDGHLLSHVPGAPALQELSPGGGGFAIDEVRGQQRRAWLFPAGTGFELDVDGLLPTQAYSVVMLVRSSDVGPYMKLLDVLDRTSDTGLYFSGDDLSYYALGFGDGEDHLQADYYYHVIVTRTAAGLYIGYIDGVERFRFQDEEHVSAISGAHRLVFFRDDTVTGDAENASGGVARIRLFDTALSLPEVRALVPNAPLFEDGFEPRGAVR